MAVPKRSLALLVHGGYFGITPSTLGYFHRPQVPWADPSQPWGGAAGDRDISEGDEAVLTPRTVTSHQRIPLLLAGGHLQGNGARNPPAPHHGDGKGTGTPPLLP